MEDKIITTSTSTPTQLHEEVEGQYETNGWEKVESTN